MKLSGGPNFSNGEALGSCGLTAHKSINAYLGLCDTCESVIMSSSLTCSGGLIKSCLYSTNSWSYGSSFQ